MNYNTHCVVCGIAGPIASVVSRQKWECERCLGIMARITPEMFAWIKDVVATAIEDHKDEMHRRSDDDGFSGT